MSGLSTGAAQQRLISSAADFTAPVPPCVPATVSAPGPSHPLVTNTLVVSMDSAPTTIEAVSDVVPYIATIATPRSASADLPEPEDSEDSEAGLQVDFSDLVDCTTEWTRDTLQRQLASVAHLTSEDIRKGTALQLALYGGAELPLQSRRTLVGDGVSESEAEVYNDVLDEVDEAKSLDDGRQQLRLCPLVSDFHLSEIGFPAVRRSGKRCDSADNSGHPRPLERRFYWSRR